jgi:GH24 family phage-related lysozyme (muramidase)
MRHMLRGFRELIRGTGRSHRAAPFRPVVERLEERRLLSTVMHLYNVVSVSSFAGVGFRENVVCNDLAVSVNGQPDFTKSDFQVQIDWGDGGTSTGDLVNNGSDASNAFYLIKGSHVYSTANTSIPINLTVIGPGSASVTALTAHANVAPMASGIAGTPPPASASGTPENVVVALGNVVTVNSFTGVGFQENVVANYLAVSVSGQPDPHPGDLQAEINWGDSDSWTTGDLVYLSHDTTSAFYEIKGSHIYTQSATGVPIVVYVSGPDGTSTSARTGNANVTPMPSGIPGTPPSSGATSLPPSDVRMALGNVVTVNAYAGVAFQDQLVANYLAISVAGEPDQTAGDLQAEINWGDTDAWTAGKLVYVDSDSASSFYEVTGSHTYAHAKQQIPIVVYVTGPDGTSVSAQTAIAVVKPNPNPALGDLTPTTWDMNQPGYNGTISVTGGSGGYKGLQVTGLPAGLDATVVNGQQSGTITISGTPSESGTFDLDVSLQDGNGASAERTYMLTIDPAVTLGALAPTQWSLNQPDYDATIAVTGGSGGYQGLQVTGLPAGLDATVVSSVVNGQQSGTITISGTPTESGTFNVNVALQDGNGSQASRSYTLTITATGLTITLGSLTPDQWDLNQPGYAGTIAISGGDGDYFAQVTGLPDGLTDSIAGATIAISGMPLVSGIFDLSISVEDAHGNQVTGSDTLTIQSVATPITLGDLAPVTWDVNQSGYQGTISVAGGLGGYPAFQITGLPTGLSAELDSASGSVNGTVVQGGTIAITGTPTRPGTFSLGVSVQDGNGDQASGSYTLTIQPSATPITLASLTPAQWTLGQPGYAGTIAISGGNGVFQEQVTGLPSGLSEALVGNAIQITGTPTASGTFPLSVAVWDTAGNQASGTDTLTINAAVVLGSLNPTEWTVNQPGYDGTINVGGGSGSYGNLQVSGLPPGLSAALSGSTIHVTGTPSASGTFGNIQVTVQDANETTGIGTYTLTVDSTALTLGSLSPTAWTVQRPGYQGAISISGGTGNYQDLQVTGLPPGLTARLVGRAIQVRGTPTQPGTFNDIAVSVQDSQGDEGAGTYSLTINSVVTLGPLDPTEWIVDKPGYAGTIPVSGGTGGYQNLHITGLPKGLSYALTTTTVVLNGQMLQSGDITITGTPTKVGVFTLTISLQDGTGAHAVDAGVGVAARGAGPAAGARPAQAEPTPRRQMTVTSNSVDLTPTVNTITPTSATDLNLFFFFGTEKVTVPVTIQNLGPGTANGTVNLSLVLATTADGTGNPISLPITLGKKTVTQYPVQLKSLAPSTGQQIKCNVTIPKTAIVGDATEYYVVATVSLPKGSNMTDTDTSNNTAHSTRTFEFVGTPTPAFAKVFNHDSPASAINKPNFGFYGYMQGVLSTPQSHFDFGAVMNDGPQFTSQFEGLYLWPYLDSKDIPTVGYGINLRLGSIKSIAGLETALVTAVADYVNSNPTLVSHSVHLKTLKRLLDKYDASTPKNRGAAMDAVVLELQDEATANGRSEKQPGSRAGLDVLAGANALSVFTVAYNVKENDTKQAFNAFAAQGFVVKPTWNTLTKAERIALVDIQFNTASGIRGFSKMLSAIKTGDIPITAFEFINSQRTLDIGARRTLACLEELMSQYSSWLGNIVTQPNH